MTIALKIGNEDSQVQGFIYLDAVTAYSRSLSGKVTSHPVDSGVSISDHFIANNKEFTIKGVVSDVDITGVSDDAVLDGQTPMNAIRRPNTPTISGQQDALQFLPSAVKQFFERSGAAVSTDVAVTSNLPLVTALFEELMGGIYYNEADKRWRNKMETVMLYEMVGKNFTNVKTNLVITSVDFEEDPDSGDSLNLSIKLEQVRLVTIQQTDMPKNAKSSVKKKVTGKEKKGTPNTDSGKKTETTSNNPALFAPNNVTNDPLAPKQPLGKYLQEGDSFQGALGAAR